MNKILSFVLALILCLGLTVTVSADSLEDTFSADDLLVFDEADILADAEETYSTSVPFYTGLAVAPSHIEIMGGKSGYTEVARRSYVLHARANGHDYICVVLKSDSYDYMCADLTYLLSYIPNNLSS